MNKLTVVAKLKAKQESVQKVKDELKKLIEPTRKEKGCIDYFMHQDNEDPSVFIFYENWEGEDFLDSHMKTDHFKACLSVIEDQLESFDLHKMTQVMP